VLVTSVLLFIFGVVIFIVGLVLSVALHELGHLSFAKLFGVRVSQYFVGFGKTLWSIRRGETEYGVKPILLGGYISMAGMFPPAKPGKAENTRSRNMLRALVQDARETSALTIGSADHSRAFYRAKPWKRIIIMFGGPVMNLLIAVGITAILVCGIGSPTTTFSDVSSCLTATASAKCASTDAESPAKAAGLRNGDVVLNVAGTAYPSAGQATAIFQRSAGKSVSVRVSRGSRELTLHVVPTLALRDKVDSTGAPVLDSAGKPVVKKLGTIGVGLGQALVQQPGTRILPTVGGELSSTVALFGRLPSSLGGVWNAAFGSAPRSINSPVSIVGVGRMIGTVTSLTGVPIVDKIYTILGLLGSLNIALFVLNLIPLLPLDGGHILGALWEMVRGAFARLFRRTNPGPVDMARFMPLTLVVVVVLVAVSALLVYADLVKPINIAG
jgi:membrane-associated protease RseP (regulator of RpoE activity)